MSRRDSVPLTHQPLAALAALSNGEVQTTGIVLGKGGRPQSSWPQKQSKTGDKNSAENASAPRNNINLQENEHMENENLEVQSQEARMPKGRQNQDKEIVIKPVIDLGAHTAMAAEKIDQTNRALKDLTEEAKDLRVSFERRNSAARVIGAGVGATVCGAAGGLIVGYLTPGPTTGTVLAGVGIGVIGGAMLGEAGGAAFESFKDRSPKKKPSKKAKKDDDDDN